MKHIGLDVHRKLTRMCWIDGDTGEVTGQSWIPTGEVIATVASLGGPKQVAFETGGQSWFLARGLQSLADVEVHVIDAFKARRALEGMKRQTKNDKIDARGMARLSLEGRTANMAVWLADQNAHDLRTLARTYLAIVRQSTALRVQMRTLLSEQGLACAATDLTGRGAQRELKELLPQLPPQGQECLRLLNDTLLMIDPQVKALRDTLKRAAQGDARCLQLLTIPGCGEILSALIVAEIVDHKRFANAAALRCYAGLTASTHQSAERKHTGKLIRGNGTLKYALTMLAQHVSSDEDFQTTTMKRRYYRCLHRYGPTVAKIDLGRQLCDIIYAMLRDGTDYCPKRIPTTSSLPDAET